MLDRPSIILKLHYIQLEYIAPVLIINLGKYHLPNIFNNNFQNIFKLEIRTRLRHTCLIFLSLNVNG